MADPKNHVGKFCKECGQAMPMPDTKREFDANKEMGKAAMKMPRLVSAMPRIKR